MAVKSNVKLADKPGFVVYCYTDSHSSRPAITHTLKQPTHWQREQRLLPVYLVLLQMEVTAFHRNLIRSSLWPYSSPHGVRPLAVILLCAARTFLPLLLSGDCLANFTVILTSESVAYDIYYRHYFLQLN